MLNYSAIFDEVQDFELNIRNVSGPGPLSAGPPAVLDPNHGLIISDTGDINAAPKVVAPFLPIANANRPTSDGATPRQQHFLAGIGCDEGMGAFRHPHAEWRADQRRSSRWSERQYRGPRPPPLLPGWLPEVPRRHQVDDQQ